MAKNLFVLLVANDAPFNRLATYAIRPIALSSRDRDDARRRESSPVPNLSKPVSSHMIAGHCFLLS